MDPTEMEDIYGSESKKAALSLFNAVRNSSKLKPSFYSLVAFKIQQLSWQKPDRPHDTIDYKYWQENGWLAKDCNYYLLDHINVLKMKFAHFVGRIAARFLI